MFTFRTPQAVSSYSGQAHKARIREKLASLFQKLFYYRPIDGEERQLDKKKLLFIGISFLSIAFVASYIPYVGDWFAKAIQPKLPFQQQTVATLPELAPELLLQEISKAIESVEVVSPVEDALVDEALQPEPEGDVIASLDEQEEEPLNILDYLFKPEDIKVEEPPAPAPVPEPVTFDDVKIDPFPIEAMPPEIRAQLGNSPPLEDLTVPNSYSRNNYAPAVPKEDESYTGSTGIFREQNQRARLNSSQLNVYADDSRVGSSISLTNSPNQEPLSIYSDTSTVGSSLHIEESNQPSNSFHQPLSNTANSYHEEIQAKQSSAFRTENANGNTSIFSSPVSDGATQSFQADEPISSQSTVFRTNEAEAASLLQYQSSLNNSDRSFVDNSAASAMGIYQIEEQTNASSTVYRNNSEPNNATSFRTNDELTRSSASFQAPATNAASVRIADTPSERLKVYVDEQPNTASSFVSDSSLAPATTVFLQNTLIGGSSYKRAIEAEIESSESQETEIEAEPLEVETPETANIEQKVETTSEELKLSDYLKASDEIDATLVTGAILLPNSSQPIVAKASSTWCKESSCPDLVFIGRADYRSGARAEIQFDKAVLDGIVQESKALALSDDKTIGLSVSLSDTTPALAQDLARGALSGVAAYANALANQVKITNTATSTIEQSSVPSIETFVLGNLAKLFATQAEQTAVVRIAELEAGTSLTVLYGVSEGPTSERYTTPFRFSN